MDSIPIKGDIMIKEIQTINVKKFGEEIVQNCLHKHNEDLDIDHIYQEITEALHEGIKVDIAYFAFKYLDDNNIQYEK